MAKKSNGALDARVSKATEEANSASMLMDTKRSDDRLVEVCAGLNADVSSVNTKLSEPNDFTPDESAELVVILDVYTAIVGAIERTQSAELDAATLIAQLNAVGA